MSLDQPSYCSNESNKSNDSKDSDGKGNGKGDVKRAAAPEGGRRRDAYPSYSTVTVFARFRGWSISRSSMSAMW